MKQIVLALFLALLVLPGVGQQQTAKREKKHTPAMSAFRVSAQENKKEKEKEFSPFSFLEAGIMGVKNNAQADSALMYINFGQDFMLIAKELPVYYDGTFNIKELERWYIDEFEKEYLPGEKQAAFYDDEGNIVRMETFFWETDQWVPYFAIEMEMDKFGEEVLYVEYFYNEDASAWEIDYGFRAVDEMNENDQLSVRIWEYYDSWNRSWVQDEMDEYFYNDNNVLVGMIFSWYDEWEEKWEPESRLSFELDDNNTWESGFSLQWDWIEEDWVKTLKYIDIEWFNFDLLQFTGMTVLINPEALDFDDFDKGIAEDEIDWMNFMRMAAAFNDEGKMILMQQEYYDHDQESWEGAFKTEWDYDALDNLTYYTFSIHDGDDWEIVEGAKADFEYNEDQSVKMIDVYLVEEDWKGEFEHFLRFELFYSEEVTSVPQIGIVSNLQVYPNPVSSGLQMVWGGSDDIVDVTIVSMDGKVVAGYNQYAVSAGIPLTLDVSHLQNGVYIIRCQGKTGSSVARFVKK